MNFLTARFATISNYLHTQRFPTTDWRNLFHWSYWTEGYISPSSVYSLFFAASILIITIGLIIWQRQLRKLQRSTPIYDVLLAQIPSLGTFMVVMCLLYGFFRTQQLNYLSSRLVLLVTFIISLAWFIGLIVYIKRAIPQKRRAYLEKERFFRYLPKKSQKGTN